MERCQRSVRALAEFLAERLDLPEDAAQEIAYLLLGNLEKQAVEKILTGKTESVT